MTQNKSNNVPDIADVTDSNTSSKPQVKRTFTPIQRISYLSTTWQNRVLASLTYFKGEYYKNMSEASQGDRELMSDEELSKLMTDVVNSVNNLTRSLNNARRAVAEATRNSNSES